MDRAGFPSTENASTCRLRYDIVLCDMEQIPRVKLVPSVERASHAIALWIEAALKDVGITQAEAHIVGYLAQVGHCSINDLHHDFGHRRSTLTSILDRLEARDLVRRTPHPTSRRSVMVELTQEGQATGERVTALLNRLDAAVRSQTAPRDLEGFYRVSSAVEEGTRDRR
jgi:DNA-binding MarR family transcriptional regulator